MNSSISAVITLSRGIDNLHTVQMENQEIGKMVGVNALPPHMTQDKNRLPSERASRFSIQRMDTADLGSNMVPRRRSSVNHGQQPGGRTDLSSCVVMEDAVDISHAPSASGRNASIRDPSKGFDSFDSQTIFPISIPIFIVMYQGFDGAIQTDGTVTFWRLIQGSLAR